MKILFGFRKFFIVLLAICLATIFLLTHHLDGKTFGDVLKGVVVAFVTANVGEHITKLLKDVFKKDK